MKGRRFAAVLAAVAIVSLAPTRGLAGSAYSASIGAGAPQGTRTLFATFPPDPYDVSLPSDDTTDGAFPLRAFAWWYGQSPYPVPHAEPRAFSVASTTQGDRDWFVLDVSQQDVDSGVSFLLEARGTEVDGVTDVDGSGGVNPVIEVYGPGGLVPTDPPDLVDADGDAITDVDPSSLPCSNDDGPWMTGGRASASLIPTSAGPYYVRVRPYWQGDFGQETSTSPVGYQDRAGRYVLQVKLGQVTRLHGASRVDTAVRISQERYPDGALVGGAVVVASGYGFPDALAGSTLAGALGCPLLFAYGTALPTATRTEIARLGASTVYVLGGGRAVSARVTEAINAMPSVTRVRRVQGRDRIQTAVEVAKRARSVVGTSGVASVAFVVNGFSYADALSASPMAASNVAPILMTSRTAMPAVTSAAIGELGITDVVIVGGAAAVSSAVESALVARLGAGHVRRISGSDRYATSAEFAAWATAGGASASVGTTASPGALRALDFHRIGVASGGGFADALGGGVFCGLGGGPILLTERDTVSPWLFAGFDPDDSVDAGEDYYSRGASPLGRSYVFGGPAAVSDDVLRSIDLITGPRIY